MCAYESMRSGRRTYQTSRLSPRSGWVGHCGRPTSVSSRVAVGDGGCRTLWRSSDFRGRGLTGSSDNHWKGLWGIPVFYDRSFLRLLFRSVLIEKFFTSFPSPFLLSCFTTGCSNFSGQNANEYRDPGSPDGPGKVCESLRIRHWFPLLTYKTWS